MTEKEYIHMVNQVRLAQAGEALRDIMPNDFINEDELKRVRGVVAECHMRHLQAHNLREGPTI